MRIFEKYFVSKQLSGGFTPDQEFKGKFLPQIIDSTYDTLSKNQLALCK